MLQQQERLHDFSFIAEKDNLQSLLTNIDARFPHLFDDRLLKGLDRLTVNCSKHFLTERTFPHLRSLMLAQFFLQNKIETTIKSSPNPKQIFLRLFRHHRRICAAVVSTNHQGFQRDQFLKIINTHLPGIVEEPSSFYLWHHPELPYYFWYIELHKLRGKEPSIIDGTEPEDYA